MSDFAARIVRALPRRHRLRAAACQLLGALVAAVIAAGLASELVTACDAVMFGRTPQVVDGAVLLVTPVITFVVALLLRRR